jgi:flagellin FlaB
MMDVCEMLKRKDVGSIGIGAMIVFIAMVLVAGIAASVLIQTSSKLETQAMKSGQETIGEVATGIAIDSIDGHVDSGTTKVDLLAINVRPRAGSADVDLSSTVIELSDSYTTNILTYDNDPFTDTGDINGDLFQTADYPTDATSFTIIVIEDADGSVTSGNPVINQGDHVILAVETDQCFGKLDVRTEVSGMIIVEEGSPGIIAFSTPASYGTDTVVGLQ